MKARDLFSGKGTSVIHLFALLGLATSSSEARRLIRGGGAKINDERIEDENYVVGGNDVKEGVIKLSAGKKRIALLRVV